MRVGLILEGTYPYATGGVAGWVHRLIRGLPDVRFVLYAIVPDAGTPRKIKYPVPDNVERIIDVPLYGGRLERGAAGAPKASDWGAVQGFHDEFKAGRFDRFHEMVRLVSDPATRRIDTRTAMHGRAAFETMCSMYERYGRDSAAFLDYFWMWRGVHLPIFRILQTDIVECDGYHSVSTGFAGLLGAVATERTGKPLLLSEHGIYTVERRQELWEMMAIGRPVTSLWDDETRRLFREWWSRLFDTVARLAYGRAVKITTTTALNVPRQVDAGAPRERIEVIPGGIDVDRLREIRKDRKAAGAGPWDVALVGRVVPVKDAKSFLEMGAVLAGEAPGLRLRIVGPAEEDDHYLQQCRDLASALDLRDRVEFTGEMDVSEVYRTADVIVLSSIREVQPFVLMEANGCGVPCVATDVGACREMLEGCPGEDRALGPSGIVVPLGDPGAMARAVREILSNRVKREAMSRAGIERVERYYDARREIRRYAELYLEQFSTRDI